MSSNGTSAQRGCPRQRRMAAGRIDEEDGERWSRGSGGAGEDLVEEEDLAGDNGLAKQGRLGQHTRRT